MSDGAILPTPRQVTRLAKLIALLGSDAEGERHAAWVAATRTLADIGWGWTGFAQHIAANAAPTAPVMRPAAAEQRDAPVRDHRRAARELLRRDRAALSDWERRFLQSLGDQARAPTSRQDAKLREILDRVGARAGGKATA